MTLDQRMTTDVLDAIRDVEWGGTPLGPMSDWPEALRLVARLVLQLEAPACLFWGLEATLIYNAAWARELGALHPRALGAGAAEISDDLREACRQALQAAAFGGAPRLDRALMPLMWRSLLDRPSSGIGCTPVLGDDGAALGLMAQIGPAAPQDLGPEGAATEGETRTAFLLRLSDALRRLDAPGEILATGARMLARLLDAERASCTELDFASGQGRRLCEYRRDGGVPALTTARLAEFGTVLRTLENGIPLVCDDLMAAGAQPANGAAFELFRHAAGEFRAQLTIPILRADRLVAVVTARHALPHRWSSAEIAVTRDAAVRIWEAVERARAEEALRQSEARHRAMFDSVDEAVCLFERLPLRPDGLRDYRYVAMNPAMQEMFGIPDLTGQSIRDNFPDEVEAWYDDYDRVLDSGEPIRIVRESEPQGKVLEMFVARVDDDSGRLLLAVMQDVTARVRAEQALRESERRLRSVLDGMDEAFGLMDHDFRIITQNAAAVRLDGRPLEEIAGRSHWEVYPGSEDSEIGRLYKRALADQVPVSLEHRFDWPDGHGATWLDMRAYPVPEGLAVFWRDITMRKEAEQALRDSEARFRALVTATADIIYRMSPDWDEMQPLEGRGLVADSSEPMRDWLATYTHPADHERIMEAVRQAIGTKGAFQLEHRVNRPDGSVGWVFSRAVPLLNEAGEITEWFGAASDITDRRQAEETARQAELRLRLAQEAAGVATFDWVIESSEGHWSPEMAQMLGLKTGALGGSYEDWISMIHPDDLPEATRCIDTAFDTGVLEGEWRVVRPDGETLWVLVRGVVERDAQNRRRRLTGAQVDITERIYSVQRFNMLIEEMDAKIAAFRRQLRSRNK